MGSSTDGCSGQEKEIVTSCLYRELHAAAACKHGGSLLIAASGQAKRRKTLKPRGETYPDVLNEHAVAEHVVVQVRVKRQPHLHPTAQRSITRHASPAIQASVG